jgi:ubiquinone/menaquinone biosynthesis C-methylase UbiE
LRLKFNEVASEYDIWRPTYVPELFADIIKFSGINQTSRALEVGIGTGQATLPFLKLNCHATAIELGDELAAFSRKKFEDYKNFEVVNMAFEDYECPDNSIDIIYSASAFHWIPEEVGYPKVYRLLKSGGTFARFANHPYKDKSNEPLHVAIENVYEKYSKISPNAFSLKSTEYNKEKCKERSDISKKYGFVDANYKLYYRIRTFDAESYAALISTYSDHRAMGTETLKLFLCEIKEVINSYGGKINVYDTLDLQLAKKP